MKNKIKLNVNYDAFCNWYFSDSMYADQVVEDLIKDGEVSIQCIADRVGYLPLDLVLNPEVVSDKDKDCDEIHETALQEIFKVILVRK